MGVEAGAGVGCCAGREGADAGLEAFLRERARAFCSTHAGLVLYSGQGDCTPTVVRTAARCVVGGTRVHRSGVAGVELMVQRGFVDGFDGDRTRCFPVWVPPLATPSTSAWHYFAGVTGLLPLLRSLKPEGVVITHYAFDRAGFAALSRPLEQYPNLYTKASPQPGPKEHRPLSTRTLRRVSTATCI